MREIALSMCRICPALCPITVIVEDGRAVKVAGDPDAPLYQGYTCPKGRALPEMHNGPQRLLHSLKRAPDGSHHPIDSSRAIDEIADKLRAIIDRHGPESVAAYSGNGQINFWPMAALLQALMRGIGSPMNFSAITIDKPGAHIALAAHGDWVAGNPSFEEADAWILVGLNPVVSKTVGFPINNPAMRLKEAEARGTKLIVIDPRATESTVRAHIHIQAKPGCDPAILAALAHVIIAEELYDEAFIAENVDGFEALRAAVAPFTPEAVAALADVSADDLIETARIFARSRFAGIGCGVGPSFALTGTVTDYLSMSLMSLCGFWSRAGDIVRKPHVLLPAYVARAQPTAPHPFRDLGHKMRVRGLACSASGLPTAALAEEILLEGKGQVRALINIGGNPIAAWPDQKITFDALSSLELLVTSCHEMSATAQISHYVIAPTLSLETPSDSSLIEQLRYIGLLRGIEGPYARYAPRVVDPPPGSDLIEDWALIYEIAKRLGVELQLKNTSLPVSGITPRTIHLDMENRPSTEELLDLLLTDARVSLAEVKKHAHGAVFDVEEIVQPRDPDCTIKLDVGNEELLADLKPFVEKMRDGCASDERFPFTMVGRRCNNIMNSVGLKIDKLLGNRRYNPAFLNPQDMIDIGVRDGDEVSITSAHGQVRTRVGVDKGLRRGILSITHSFGGVPGDDANPDVVGCNVNQLISTSAEYDPVTGIPRMGAIPVRIERTAAM